MKVIAIDIVPFNVRNKFHIPNTELSPMYTVSPINKYRSSNLKKQVDLLVNLRYQGFIISSKTLCNQNVYQWVLFTN